MRRRLARRLRARAGATAGQVVPLVALALLVFIGMMGLVIDVGQLHVVQRKLQIAADAAALAGAAQLSTSTTAATTAADDYDGTAPNMNGLSGYAVTTTILYGCLSSATVGGSTSCTPNTAPNTPFSPQCLPTNTPSCTPNAIRVIESTSVSPLFMGALNVGAKQLSATATASETGGIPEPIDVEMIDDSTRSMDSGDTCTPTGISADGTVPTQEDCAKEGIAFLLATLLPCSTTLSSCGSSDASENITNPIDRIGLMVFPAMCGSSGSGTTCSSTITSGTTGVPDETGCASANYTAIAGSGTPNTTYDYSTTHYMSNSTGWYSNYQVVPFESDYRSSDAASSSDANNPWLALNTNSSLVKAIWWYQCGSHTFPGDSGGDEQYGIEDPGGRGTYYGDAILQAQNAFASAGRAGVHDAIILLSDGDATATSSDLKYSHLDPSGTDECQAGITAAEAAETAGVEFFSIAYGANTGGCASDTSSASTCNATTQTDCTDDSAICTMELMADNHVTNPSYANDYQAEQALCGSSATYASNPTYHFFNTPTGSAFASAFESVGNQLTSARLVPDTAT